MKHIPYQNMKAGEIYLFYKNMEEGKIIGLFRLADSIPIMDSFSIIMITEAIMKKNGSSIKERKNYASSLSPTSDYIYQLNSDEFDSHILIPEL